MVGANFLYQLIFRHSLGIMVDIVTLGTEELNGLLGDIFENEETKALVVDGVEDLGLPNGARILTTSIGETVVDGKRRGGDGGADDVRRRAWDRNGGRHCWRMEKIHDDGSCLYTSSRVRSTQKR